MFHVSLKDRKQHHHVKLKISPKSSLDMSEQAAVACYLLAFNSPSSGYLVTLMYQQDPPRHSPKVNSNSPAIQMPAKSNPQGRRIFLNA